MEHTSLWSSIKQSIAVLVLFLHGLHLGWGWLSFSHHHHTALFLFVFRLLPLRKLRANEYYVALLKESLHVVRWMEMKHGVGPEEPLLLLSATQQMWLRKLHGTGHALEVSGCLPRSFKVSGTEEKVVTFSCRQATHFYDKDTVHHPQVVPPGLVLAKCQAHAPTPIHIPLFSLISAHAILPFLKRDP